MILASQAVLYLLPTRASGSGRKLRKRTRRAYGIMEIPLTAIVYKQRTEDKQCVARAA